MTFAFSSDQILQLIMACVHSNIVVYCHVFYANVCLLAHVPRSRSIAAFHVRLASRFLSEINAFSQLYIETTHTSSYHCWRIN